MILHCLLLDIKYHQLQVMSSGTHFEISECDESFLKMDTANKKMQKGKLNTRNYVHSFIE